MAKTKLKTFRNSHRIFKRTRKRRKSLRKKDKKTRHFKDKMKKMILTKKKERGKKKKITKKKARQKKKSRKILKKHKKKRRRKFPYGIFGGAIATHILNSINQNKMSGGGESKSESESKNKAAEEDDTIVLSEPPKSYDYNHDHYVDFFNSENIHDLSSRELKGKRYVFFKLIKEHILRRLINIHYGLLNYMTDSVSDTVKELLTGIHGTFQTIIEETQKVPPKEVKINWNVVMNVHTRENVQTPSDIFLDKVKDIGVQRDIGLDDDEASKNMVSFGGTSNDGELSILDMLNIVYRCIVELKNLNDETTEILDSMGFENKKIENVKGVPANVKPEKAILYIHIINLLLIYNLANHIESILENFFDSKKFTISPDSGQPEAVLGVAFTSGSLGNGAKGKIDDEDLDYWNSYREGDLSKLINQQPNFSVKKKKKKSGKVVETTVTISDDIKRDNPPEFMIKDNGIYNIERKKGSRWEPDYKTKLKEAFQMLKLGDEHRDVKDAVLRELEGHLSYKTHELIGVTIVSPPPPAPDPDVRHFLLMSKETQMDLILDALFKMFYKKFSTSSISMLGIRPATRESNRKRNIRICCRTIIYLLCAKLVVDKDRDRELTQIIFNFVDAYAEQYALPTIERETMDYNSKDLLIQGAIKAFAFLNGSEQPEQRFFPQPPPPPVTAIV